MYIPPKHLTNKDHSISSKYPAEETEQGLLASADLAIATASTQTEAVVLGSQMKPPFWLSTDTAHLRDVTSKVFQD